MKMYFKNIILLLAILLPTFAGAYDFEVDGIYYYVRGNNAEVTYKDYINYNSYNGNIVIPESVTYNGKTYTVKSIGEHAFSASTGVTSIFIPNSITSIGYSAFSGCTGLTDMTIPNSITAISNYAFSACTGLTNVTIPNTVTSIGEQAFERCVNLKSVIIPNSVTTIKYAAFASCSGLTSITIPNSVTSIGKYAFRSCIGLKNITIGESVVSIGELAFQSCSNIESIVINSSNLFYDSRDNCNAIIETMTNTLITGCKNTFIPNSINVIERYAFCDCEGLTNILLPNSLTSIGEYAFCDCESLTSIVIPNSVITISNEAFVSCDNLSSVIFGSSVATIGDRAFAGCNKISSIEIPSSVSYIGERAFSYCNLNNIFISNSVINIGANAFISNKTVTNLSLKGDGEWHECGIGSKTSYLFIDKRFTSIKGIQINPSAVYCYATVPPECDDNSFLDYSGTLHVPPTSLAAYFTAPYWCNFTNIIGDAEEPMIRINQDSIEVLINNYYYLTASILPANAFPSNVTWKSTNPDVATVNNGIVSAIGVGECDIIARCLFSEAICHVVVKESNITIYLDKQEVSLLPNHITMMTPSASSDALPELAIRSSDPTVAAARVMNGKVQIVGIKEGTTTITVGSADGTAIPATCLVTVYTEPGDLNSDGFINIGDASQIIDYLLSGDGSDIKLDNADVNRDGKVNIGDVAELIDILLSSN